jgi:excisionase family DNA binding protein
MSHEQSLNVQQAAELLGIKPSTLRAWCLRRRLRYFKSGRCVRFRREWLEEFIDRNTIPQAPSKTKGLPRA